MKIVARLIGSHVSGSCIYFSDLQCVARLHLSCTPFLIKSKNNMLFKGDIYRPI
jgi:hypothetical protein